MARDERQSLPWLATGLTLGILVLGAWGFASYEPTAPASQDVYRSLQLFVMESGDLSGTLPWQLEVARLAAPALTAASAALAVLVLSRNRFDVLRARRSSGHVIVCGLGRRGTPAAVALSRSGRRVVGIEHDSESAGIGRCRHAGIPVVVGDARDPAVLARAGVQSARHLVVLTASLDLAGKVALAAIESVQCRKGRPLAVHLEVDRPELAAIVRAMGLTEHRASSWRLEDLDLAGIGARAMLDAQAPWPDSARRADVVVVGGTPLGRALVHEVTRQWNRSGGDWRALRVTLIDSCGDDVAESRLPDGRADAARPRVVVRPDLPVSQPRDDGADDWSREVAAAYVCLADEDDAIAAAIALHTALPATPILLRLEHATAFAELLSLDAPMLKVFSLESSVLTPEVLLDTTVERIARSLHDFYRREASEDDPSAVPWDRLPPQLVASNRAQAEHVAEKVRAAGRALVPDDGEPPDDFTTEEVDHLGKLEHERWVAERLSAGWTPGPRDPALKTTPYLVPWEELDEAVREIDRRFVRALPDILADAGLVLRRCGPAATAGAKGEGSRK